MEELRNTLTEYNQLLISRCPHVRPSLLVSTFSIENLCEDEDDFNENVLPWLEKNCKGNGDYYSFETKLIFEKKEIEIVSIKFKLFK